MPVNGYRGGGTSVVCPYLKMRAANWQLSGVQGRACQLPVTGNVGAGPLLYSHA